MKLPQLPSSNPKFVPPYDDEAVQAYALAAVEAFRAECVRLIRPKDKRPCDCDHCDCGNSGDRSAVVAWDESNSLADAIKSLEIEP